jgi:hypothetical protein
MNVTIGNTSKRINSTSNTFSGTTLGCRLKEPCSMQSPVFMVQGLTKGNLYNYCSFEGRYYWVDDIVYLTNNIQEVHCHLDPLATYANAIKNTYAYCTYADSAHRSEQVDDTRFGPDFKWVSEADRKGSIDIGFDYTSWTVIMTANAAYDLGSNGVLTYAMSYSNFASICNAFASTVLADFSSFTPADIADMIKNFIVKLLCGGGSALDNIKSCIMVPIPLSTISPLGVASSTINIGPYQLTGLSENVYIMNPNVIIKSPLKLIPLHRMLASSSCHWLRTPKYCTIKITHPCGYLDINDPSLMDNNTYVYMYATLSPITGDYMLRFMSESDDDDDTIAVCGGNVAVDIMGLMNNTDGTIAGQMFKAEAMAATAAVSSLAALKQPATSTATRTTETTNLDTGEVHRSQTKTTSDNKSMSSGIEGNFLPGGFTPAHGNANISSGLVGICALPNNGEISYDIEYYYPSIFANASASEYNSFCAEYGYPCNRYLKLGDVSGYVQCAGASVQGATGASEASKSTINSYINNGIYIE